MKTSKDPICGPNDVANDVIIDSSAVIEDKVFLLFGKYFYESVFHMKRHVIEMNAKPKSLPSIGNEWIRM